MLAAMLLPLYTWLSNQIFCSSVAGSRKWLETTDGWNSIEAAAVEPELRSLLWSIARARAAAASELVGAWDRLVYRVEGIDTRQPEWLAGASGKVGMLLRIAEMCKFV